MYVCVYMSCMCERGWSKVGGTEMGEQTEQRCVCGCVDVLLCVYERKGIGCVCVCVCVCVWLDPPHSEPMGGSNWSIIWWKLLEKPGE